MSDYVDGRESGGTGMSAGNPVHTLYIGSPDGNSFGTADRAAVVEKLSSCFASFTINDAEGFFEGRPVATLIVSIATGDSRAVEKVALNIGRKLGQRKVGLELKGLYQSISMD